MAKAFIEEDTLTAIGNAIRSKGNTTKLLKPSEMAGAIMAMVSGDIPETALTLSGNCDYWNYGGTWDWFCELYGSEIHGGVIISGNGMFYGSELANIPFDIFMGGDGRNDCSRMFMSATNLKSISSNMTIRRPNNLAYMCYDCSSLTSFTPTIGTTDYVNNTSINGDFEYMFGNCTRLKTISPYFLENMYCYGTNKNLLNCNAFMGCKSLTELRNLTIGYASDRTINICGYQPFKDCYSITEIIFKSDQGITNLSNQNLRITGNVGYSNYEDISVSRYNRNSAINTINSLPNISLGSNNIVQFNGASGSSTDGGAINTMTEEEIAVAVAKGWTVSFV